MNERQRLYLIQARSDREVLQLLASQPACHQLLYLQMLTEKLAKAYFWRTPGAKALGHAAFVRFIRAIATNRRVAEGIGFRDLTRFGEWIADISDIAYELERLAPALAADGPNTEYPWPRASPEHASVEHDFAFSRRLRSRNGFNLLRMLDLLLENFENWF
ncbi:hypothetical protein [Singulisphaera acidiphila]|uniref:HEPN domain-containing protein n=1 Tax=Singulisphaera acidiphila (strain ATCC BAA-1392 / DSM 18658 / VKM B-2454 / MOB10) TaxID=886293 RepID=L0D811_SINAD|nr:hypothetical protein [Singulisphaera acidiphila]AGA25005.1 hypothetical protein Sinac_0581 [Singulisphaera acidiphila DSM 18658]